MSTFDRSTFKVSIQPDISEIASEFVSLVCVSLLSILFGIKTYNVQYKYLSCSRWLITALYALSWAFTISATVFVSTNNGNFLSCFLSEVACDLFYAGTKIIIYAWLIEKVWVVSASREPRWKTKSYQLHMILITPYIGILALMFTFHITEIEENGVCIIGLRPAASIPLLIYDFVFNTYMTILFIKPLMHTESKRLGWKTSKLHQVARRTLVASVVALLVSFANILTLTVLGGRERGVLCLTCCTVDVTINIVTIHWVKKKRERERERERAKD
ncbi:hypothetical protein BD770DRAFT_326996 [Pilaira anomala]|nr:hypothetical protein BD770DRAFT_326996 [Pilaira anomala]